MRLNVQRSLFLFVCILLGGLPLRAQTGASAERREADTSKNSPTPSYVIQPNDILEIYVWKEPDLTRKVVVRPDGRISFPLVQDTQAAGLTPGDIKEQIERELKNYIEVPNVTVIVEAIRSYQVYVTGKVVKAGALTVEKPMTVLQALSLAGGFLEFANPAEMVIIRSTAAGNVLYKFNYNEVVKGRNSDQNIILKSGDVVVVP
jgi:polysaccharide biosynthesis/export protein